MVLIAGIGIGWLLRGTIEPMPHEALPVASLPTNVHEVLSVTDDLIDSPVSTLHSKSVTTPIKSPLEQLADLLNSGRDDEAIEWYVSLSRENGDIDGARHLINQQVSAREQRNEVQAAVRLLTRLIEELPQAFNERLALASLYQRDQRFYPALLTLFDAMSVASTSDELTQLDRLIEQTVRLAQRSFADDDIQANIKLFQFLIQHHAAHTPYYIELAKWFIKASQLDAAIEQLNVVQYDPFVGDTAQKMLAEIERLRLKLLETPLALQRKGSHFMVDAILNHRDIRLLIDTGASLTVLDSAAAAQLGLNESDMLQRMQMNTANGVTEALLYRIDSMALGVFSVSPMDIAVVEHLEVNGASGLLGMNFLQHFEFRIDQSDAQLFLKYRDE
jgi:clan AA aspartic protease (TIGR02281 family)